MPEKIKRLDPQDNTVESGKLDDVSGGYTFDSYFCGHKDEPYEVIDDKDGSIVERFASLEDANKYADEHGYSTRRLNWPELYKLRTNDAAIQHRKYKNKKQQKTGFTNPY